MSLRSPLGRVLGLGSAKGGSGHWYSQRLTAVALVILGLWFVASLAMLGQGASHSAVVHWLGSPLPATLAVLLVLVAGYHAQLGMRVVLEDYVGDKGLRTVLVTAVNFLLITASLLGVLAVLRLALGVPA